MPLSGMSPSVSGASHATDALSVAAAGAIATTPQEIFRLVCELRRSQPLVHNITNFVAMNVSANALLAIGASPVMAHAIDEVREMIAVARSLVLNIGTLDQSWIVSMKAALSAASELGRPVVFDPVGVGATRFRTDTARELIESHRPTVIRGNASEVLVLAGAQGRAKGVDSQAASCEACSAARELATDFGCIVCVSGAVDYVIDARRTVVIENGHPMMGQVTAMGCTASSLIGAFLGVDRDAFLATQAAMVTMSVAGELAAERANGPGSFQVEFLDALAALSANDLCQRARLRVAP